MKRFLPLLLLTGLLFGQDILTTKSGETYRGKYLGELDDDKISGYDYDNMLIVDMPDINMLIGEGWEIKGTAPTGGHLVALPIADIDGTAVGLYGYGVFHATDDGVVPLNIEISGAIEGGSYFLVKEGIISSKLLGHEGANDGGIPDIDQNGNWINNRRMFESTIDMYVRDDPQVKGISKQPSLKFRNEKQRYDAYIFQMGMLLNRLAAEIQAGTK